MTARTTIGVLLRSEDSGGRVALVDNRVPAGTAGPPLHRHDFGSESFYVIEGRMRVLVGDDELTIGPGEIAQIPQSTPHSFLTLEYTRVLDIIAPAGLWDFFVECGEPATELRLPDVVKIPPDLAEIVSRYNGKVLGPPPWR